MYEKISGLCVCFAAVVLLAAAGTGMTGCSSDLYSEEQHIQRIRERPKKADFLERSERFSSFLKEKLVNGGERK